MSGTEKPIQQQASEAVSAAKQKASEVRSEAY
jgi:hypothetical protein